VRVPGGRRRRRRCRLACFTHLARSRPSGLVSVMAFGSLGVYALVQSAGAGPIVFLVTVVVVVVTGSACTLPCPVLIFSDSLSQPRSTAWVDPGWFRVQCSAPSRSWSSSSSSSFRAHLVRPWSLPGVVGPFLVRLDPPVMELRSWVVVVTREKGGVVVVVVGSRGTASEQVQHRVM
jgi:hypothetical protein